MKRQILTPIFVTLLLTGCSNHEAICTDEQNTEQPAQLKKNDFPTRDRVEYVLECVAKHGGLNYINQYACGCKIDKMAEQMTFEEFEAARTFGQMQKTPGEQGAAFRDPKQSKDLRGKLKEAEAMAEKACFVQ